MSWLCGDSSVRQKLAATRLQHSFTVVNVVNCLLKLAKLIQCHLFNCHEAYYVTVDSLARSSSSQYMYFFWLFVVWLNSAFMYMEHVTNWKQFTVIYKLQLQSIYFIDVFLPWRKHLSNIQQTGVLKVIQHCFWPCINLNLNCSIWILLPWYCLGSDVPDDDKDALWWGGSAWLESQLSYVHVCCEYL